MRKIALFIGLAVLAPGAMSFDINEYCQQVADSIGGSYQIEESCRDQEREAKRSVESSSASHRIISYCRDVGQAVGGSYSIMNACIRQEMAAKKRISG